MILANRYLKRKLFGGIRLPDKRELRSKSVLSNKRILSNKRRPSNKKRLSGNSDHKKSGTKSFNERVWEACKRIPSGKVATYKDLAYAVGTKGYRAVGNALNKNPYAPNVPCHRVVNSDGRVGGFAKGNKAKVMLLKEEGISVKKGKVVGFSEARYNFWLLSL